MAHYSFMIARASWLLIWRKLIDNRENYAICVKMPKNEHKYLGGEFREHKSQGKKTGFL